MPKISVWRMALLAAGLAVLTLAFSHPAEARKWKPTPNKLAQDYAIIIDGRSSGELVGVVWFTPQFAEGTSDVEKLLDQYILIAVVRGHMDGLGTIEFDDNADLEVLDTDGKPLTELKGDKMPPAMAGATAALGGIFRQALGPMGKGMHFFVFESGKVHACLKGKLTVEFAGENYTYDTPFPGCPEA